MLRALGAGLIACSVTGIGIWITVRERKRVQALENAIQAVNLLKTVVTRQLLPLKDAIHMLADQNTLLRHIDTEGDDRIEVHPDQYALGKEETRILQALFYAIPRAGAGSAEHFDSAQEQLLQQLSIRKKAADQASMLYPKLSILCGAATFLMLL